ncbi:hypothetical protein CBOM_05361 [Ceraceosorus bombacis]|uniref:Uncharacterized protein n=1 Tax=Ceraceosorus bombacis TaxID=401625 RepID=A0A0P1BRB6_9BASI|nr:hypothetical protein CBOM_05361 [Ceraceosorus bombacis]
MAGEVKCPTPSPKGKWIWLAGQGSSTIAEAIAAWSYCETITKDLSCDCIKQCIAISGPNEWDFRRTW